MYFSSSIDWLFERSTLAWLAVMAILALWKVVDIIVWVLQHIRVTIV